MTLKQRVGQIGIVINGLSFALVGLVLIVTPQWFYQNIGDFPPFNRHYSGDLGTYSLPIGIALLVAAREPLKNKLIVAMAFGVGLLHMFNHVFDAILIGGSITYWLSDIGPLAFFEILLGVALLPDAKPDSAQ
jgi:hypothetical protein